jgi:hypothetical protein
MNKNGHFLVNCCNKNTHIWCVTSFSKVPAYKVYLITSLWFLSPLNHAPCTAIHLVNRLFHCSEHFWNLSSGMLFRMAAACPWMSTMSENLWLPKVIICCRNTRKFHGAKSDKCHQWPNFVIDCLADKCHTMSDHEQRHCQDARSKHQTKVHVFSNKQLHVTVPKFPSHYVASCFDLILDGLKFKKITIFAWGCNMHVFTGLLTPDFTMLQHHKPRITSAVSPYVLVIWHKTYTFTHWSNHQWFNNPWGQNYTPV